MYKNQLQELAQRSCFNLPSYACIREGPDHAPRFKASVNFNGEIFEGPSYCTTLRFAEHSAAEVALNTLSTRGLSRSLTARVLDETGVYKNLLQETAHRAGLNLPVYTTVRSGPGHLPVFTCTVELACMNFTGESAKTKKQAEKNAAMTAWSALKQMPNLGSSCQKNKESESSEEQELVVVTRDLSNFRSKDENKTSRQREQNQARRSVSSYRDNNSGSSSHCSLQYRQWRSMDLLPDPSSAYPTQRNYFLPKVPPPPQTASKILLPTSSRDHKQSLYSSNSSRSIPVQVKSRLEENQKDEEEWLNGKKPEVTEKSNEKELNSGNSGCVFRSKPTYQRPFSLPNTGKHDTPISDLHRTQQTDIRTRPSRPPTITSAAAAAAMIRTMAQVQAPVPKILNSDGFYAHGIAPAVHIRSVIPVCAAPPMRSPSSSTTPTPQMKEASPSSPHTQKNGSQQTPV